LLLALSGPGAAWRDSISKATTVHDGVEGCIAEVRGGRNGVKSAGAIERRAADIVPQIGVEKVEETTAVSRPIECRRCNES
jgi:hypothetical protein